MQIDLHQLDGVLEKYPKHESSLIMLLQDIQTTFRYLPEQALEYVANYLGLPLSRVYAVATFYKVFSFTPQGRTLVQICKGTACHVRGADILEDELCRTLGVSVNQTTDDFSFTLKTVNCVGACALAPVVMVGDDVVGRAKPGNMKKLIETKGTPDED